MASIQRNHKPNVTICRCDRCGEFNPSAPAGHPHRKCVKVTATGESLVRATASTTKGTWQKVSKDDYTAYLAEHTAGPNEDDLAAQELLREASGKAIPQDLFAA